jgi:diguanylate cyclase
MAERSLGLARARAAKAFRMSLMVKDQARAEPRPEAPADTSREATLAHVAMERINALGLAPDPINFETFYTYASGHNKALNRAVDAIARANTWSAAAVRQVYDEFLSPDRFLNRVHKVSDSLRGEAGQLTHVIEQATESASVYRDTLTGASLRLNKPAKQQTLDAVVAALVRSTDEVVKTNTLLHAQLAASREQVQELQVSLEVLQTESMTDPLTATLNRNAFDRAFARMVAAGEPLCLLLVDVDRFKTFNDGYGHQVGDDVLRLVALTLKQSTRETDIVARIGGDEFAIIVPKTSVAQATVLAEQIRQAVKERQIFRRSTGETLGRISISTGVAEFMAGLAPEDVIQRADTSLYGAKRAGRDCVLAWSPAAA